MSTCLAGVSAQAQEFGGHKVATEMHRSPGTHGHCIIPT